MMLTVLLAAMAAQQGGMVSNSKAAPPVAMTNSAPPPAVVAVDSTGPAPMIVAVDPPPLIRTPVSLPPPVVVPVRVRVTAGSQLLLDDTFRIARNANASYSQNRSEAPARLCASDRYYGYGERQSLSVQLHLREDPAQGAAVNVSVNWQRPSGSADCGPEGSRTVSLVETVPLGPGQSATVRGDAGLTVALTRR